MNTIKFERYHDEYKIREKKGDACEMLAKSVSLMEGRDIWRRPFMIRTIEEYEKWYAEWMFGDAEIHVVGSDPEEEFKNVGSFNCFFEYLCFHDPDGNFHKCLVFCADCFIMNEQGQTVDKFTA